MDDLATTVFCELRAIARAKLAQQPAHHTLQPSALVNEAWMKLRGHFDSASGTPHFYRTAAEAMRQILVDHARGKHRIKRGAGVMREDRDLNQAIDRSTDFSNADFLDLNDALVRLEELDPQSAAVVKVKFFAGLGLEESAKALDVSVSTVKRDWEFARNWLAKELSASASQRSNFAG